MSFSPDNAPAAIVNALGVSCPACGAAAGVACKRPLRYALPPNTAPHRAREIRASQRRLRRVAGTPLEAAIAARVAAGCNVKQAAALTGAGLSTVYNLLRRPRAQSIDLPADFKRARR